VKHWSTGTCEFRSCPNGAGSAFQAGARGLPAPGLRRAPRQPAAFLPEAKTAAQCCGRVGHNAAEFNRPDLLPVTHPKAHRGQLFHIVCSATNGTRGQVRVARDEGGPGKICVHRRTLRRTIPFLPGIRIRLRHSYLDGRSWLSLSAFGLSTSALALPGCAADALGEGGSFRANVARRSASIARKVRPRASEKTSGAARSKP